MKTVTYKYENMARAGILLNKINICGVEQARILAEIGNILDSGKIGEINEREEPENGMEAKKV